jgi:hypothetical protein
MARTYQKFPRITYTALDAEGTALGEVVAKNEHEALERAQATYDGAASVVPTSSRANATA